MVSFATAKKGCHTTQFTRRQHSPGAQEGTSAEVEHCERWPFWPLPALFGQITPYLARHLLWELMHVYVCLRCVRLHITEA
jgi:hypothetical protein